MNLDMLVVVDISEDVVVGYRVAALWENVLTDILFGDQYGHFPVQVF